MSSRPGAVTRWVRRRPLTAFFALIFGIGWPVLAIPVAASHTSPPAGQLPLPVFVLIVTFGVLLPAALAITGATEGRRGVTALVRRAGRWRFGWPSWVLVVVGVPALTLLGGLIVGASLTVDPVRLGGDLLSMASAIVVIHLVEELVWAGFVQTRLAARHGLAAAAVLTAVPFAALHLPLSLIGPFTARSVLADAAGLLLLGLLLRLAIGLLARPTAGSVLAAAVLHGSFNAANNGGGLVDGLLAEADQGLLAVVALALVVGVGLVWRRRTRSGSGFRTRSRLLDDGTQRAPANPGVET